MGSLKIARFLRHRNEPKDLQTNMFSKRAIRSFYPKNINVFGDPYRPHSLKTERRGKRGPRESFDSWGKYAVPYKTTKYLPNH